MDCIDIADSSSSDSVFNRTSVALKWVREKKSFWVGQTWLWRKGIDPTNKRYFISMVSRHWFHNCSCFSMPWPEKRVALQSSAAFFQIFVFHLPDLIMTLQSATVTTYTRLGESVTIPHTEMPSFGNAVNGTFRRKNVRNNSVCLFRCPSLCCNTYKRK